MKRLRRLGFETRLRAIDHHRKFRKCVGAAVAVSNSQISQLICETTVGTVGSSMVRIEPESVKFRSSRHGLAAKLARVNHGWLRVDTAAVEYNRILVYFTL